MYCFCTGLFEIDRMCDNTVDENLYDVKTECISSKQLRGFTQINCECTEDFCNGAIYNTATHAIALLLLLICYL